MKKMIVLLAAALFLSGCDGKEKDELVDLLTNKFKEDKDLADYQIEPEEMADCVVGKILTEIPGFPGSPKRTKYIVAYSRLIAVKTPAEVKQALDDTTEVFGSAKEARKAVTDITMHNFSCIGDLVNANPETMTRQTEEEPENQSPAEKQEVQQQ